MKSAVIKTGGKQYLVNEGDVLRVETLEIAEGKPVTFKEVLLTTSAKDAVIGTPFIEGVAVEAKVIKHGQADKIYGAKMKPKKRYMRYFGHRQHFTEIEITKIA